MGANVALVLRHQKIFDREYKPGDFLTSEEYDLIDSYARDAMESDGLIKKVFDEDAARIIADLMARVEALETWRKEME